MTPILIIVKVDWNEPLIRRLAIWAMVAATINPTASGMAGSDGKDDPRYEPKVIATSAVGAANPTVDDTQPDTKPAIG